MKTTGYITWLNAIAGNSSDNTETYLWGSYSYKPPYTGNKGVEVRWFEFETRLEPVDKGDIFFIQLTNINKELTDSFRLCIARGKYSMYAFGGHIYPIPDIPKWRIVKEIDKKE